MFIWSSSFKFIHTPLLKRGRAKAPDKPKRKLITCCNQATHICPFRLKLSDQSFPGFRAHRLFFDFHFNSLWTCYKNQSAFICSSFEGSGWFAPPHLPSFWLVVNQALGIIIRLCPSRVVDRSYRPGMARPHCRMTYQAKKAAFRFWNQFVASPYRKPWILLFAPQFLTYWKIHRRSHQFVHLLKKITFGDRTRSRVKRIIEQPKGLVGKHGAWWRVSLRRRSVTNMGIPTHELRYASVPWRFNPSDL